MNLWQQFTVPITDTDLFTRLRIRFIQALAVVGIIAAGLGLMAQAMQNPNIGMVFTFIFMLMCGGLLVLVQRRLITLAATLLVAVFVISALAFKEPFIVLGVLALIASATLVNLPTYIVANVILFGKYVFDLVQTPLTPDGRISQQGVQGLFVLTTLIIVSSTMRYFVDTAQKSVQNTKRNAFLLQATAEIGQVAATLLDLEQMFTRAAELIRDRFGFQHVQIYIMDEQGEQAALVAATGDEGQELLAHKYKLPVGSTNVVGRAAGSGGSIVVRESDSAFQRNPLLSQTRAEAAIPILEGEKVIGVLDVQSARRDAFQAEDMQAFQTMASLIGTAIRNARLFEAQTRSVQEQQRLFLESESNLREIQRLNQQLTKAGWTDYVGQPNTVSGITLEDNEITSETGWTESLLQATQNRRPVVREGNGKPGVVAVPVLLRGEVIGAIEVEPGDDSQQSSAVEMIQAVAQRLAISLDNARLFEEANAATAQEQRINQIVSRYQSAASVDDILRITLTELSQTFGAQRGAIRLGKAQVEGQQNGDATP